MSYTELPNSEERNVGQAAGVVGLFTLFSRILGLVRDMVVAFFFGAGPVTDAFFVAFRIPNLLRRLFAEGSLTIAFIPIFTEYLTTKSKQDAIEMARIVLTLLMLVLVIVTVLGILFAPFIVRIQAAGFGQDNTYQLCVVLTRIMFPYILLISIVAFFMGVLNSLRHFAAPAAAPVFLNLGMIGAAYLISPYLREPIVGLAIGVLFGGILQVFLQIPWALKNGFNLIPRLMPNHPAIKRIGLLMLPAIFGSAIYQLNAFVGTLLASFLDPGSVSWLFYADRLVEFPLGVFAIAISTAALPSFSTQAIQKNFKRLAETLGYSLRLVFFIILPSIGGLVILGKQIIQIFFERGAFDAYSTLMIYYALICYAIGLWAFSGIRVMVASFYALQDTKTPVRAAFISFAINFIFSLYLMKFLLHGGIALALSIASTIQFLILLILMRLRIGYSFIKSVLKTALKSMAATTIMCAVIYYLQHELFAADISEGLLIKAIHLSVTIIIGMVIYFGLTWIFKCPELASLKEIFDPFLKKKKHTKNLH